MWKPGQREEKYLVLDFLIRWSLLSTQEYASFIVYRYERYETGTMFSNFMNIYLFIFKTAVHSVMVSDYPTFGWTVSCNTDAGSNRVRVQLLCRWTGTILPPVHAAADTVNSPSGCVHKRVKLFYAHLFNPSSYASKCSTVSHVF